MCNYSYFDRVCAPPHAAVRGGVPTVCLPLDEQPTDEGAAATLHNQTVGHLPGTNTHSKASVIVLFVICPFLSFWLCMGYQKRGNSLIKTSFDCLRSGTFVILPLYSSQSSSCTMELNIDFFFLSRYAIIAAFL